MYEAQGKEEAAQAHVLELFERVASLQSTNETLQG